MAKGFTINRPRARRNPERLTLVNPRPRATSGWFSTSRSSSTATPAENPKRKGTKKRVTRLAKPVGEKAKSAGKKSSTKKSSTRASRSGAKKTQRQRRQPRSAAGKKKTVATRKTVRYGKAVSSRKSAPKRKRAAAPKRRVKRSTAPKRKVKRNTAPKANASARKAPRGKTWRKGYTTKAGKRVKGGWVKKAKRNPFDAQGKYYVATVGTGKGKRKAQSSVSKKQFETARAEALKAAKKTKKKSTGRKPAKKAPPKKRTAPKKAAARKTTAKRRPAVKRARAKTPRYYRKRSGAPKAGMTWRKGFTRKDGTRVSGMWVKKGGKKRRKGAAKKKTTYKRSKPRVTAGRGRTKKGKITVRRKKTSYMSGGRAGRYRVRTKAKRYGKRKSYLRSYPKRRRVQTKKSTYKRRYPKKYVRRSRGGKVWVKGFTRKDGTKVKGHWMRKPKRGRYAITGAGKARRIAANPKRKRNMGRKSNPYKRTGYKGGKIRVKGYSYKHPRTGKIVRVKGHSRKQWYPKRYPRRGTGSKWLKQRDSYRRGLMSKYEAKRFGFAANPGALVMLPTKDQLLAVGQAAGVGAVGFGGAVAIGRLFSRIGIVNQYLGTWAPAVGNVLGGLGMWMAANAIDNPKLNEMKPYIAIGAGVAAIVNVALNFIARGWVPRGYAAWFMPGAAAVEVAPAAAVAPDSAAATSGFGQIDVYEAALDGMGDIESELERELERMSGDDGIFSDAGVFGEYLETPMGAMVEQAYAGMGASVEEAFAGGGSGGVGEYLQTPMGEYLQTPMGEYLETPMGEYLETPMGAMVEQAYAGMGAQVEAAYAGLGQANGNGNGNGWSAFEQSIKANPLMPGFRAAVQSLVRKRIAAGQPLDDAFYAKLGRASADLAKQKFQQRVQQVQGKPSDLPVEAWKAPLLRSSAPMYKRNIPDPAMVPGTAEPIAAAGPQEGAGIFFGTGDEDEGIL